MACTLALRLDERMNKAVDTPPTATAIHAGYFEVRLVVIELQLAARCMRVGGVSRSCRWPALSQIRSDESVNTLKSQIREVSGNARVVEVISSLELVWKKKKTNRWWLSQAHISKKMYGNMTSQAFKMTSAHSKSAAGKDQKEAVHRSMINSRRLHTATAPNWETNRQGLLTTPPIRPAASSTHEPPRLM